MADFLLTGIVNLEGEQYAIINNEFLKVGEYTEGKRVFAIYPKKVELFEDGKIVTLILP